MTVLVHHSDRWRHNICASATVTGCRRATPGPPSVERPGDSYDNAPRRNRSWPLQQPRDSPSAWSVGETFEGGGVCNARKNGFDGLNQPPGLLEAPIGNGTTAEFGAEYYGLFTKLAHGGLNSHPSSPRKLPGRFFRPCRTNNVVAFNVINVVPRIFK